MHLSRAHYSPACSEELADVPRLLRFLKVAKNKVEVLGVKSIGKLGRRGRALSFHHMAEVRSKCVSTQGCKSSHLPSAALEGRSFLLEHVLWV